MAVTVDIAPAFSRSVGNGGRLVGYNYADSVSLLYFPSDLGPAQNTWNMSHEQYAALRQEKPTLELPELKPRKPGTNANGNTLGTVVGETPSTAAKAQQANPEVKPETPKEESWWSSWGSSVTHTVLDIGGVIPVVGIFSDGANAAIYAAEGDYANAAISGASAAANLVPGGGIAAKAGKVAIKGALKGGERAGIKQAEKLLAERIAKEKLEKEAAEAAAEKAAQEAAQEAAEKKAASKAESGGSKKKDTQVKKKPKPKPKCGQKGPYKDRNNHDNAGVNWDHVPSKEALLRAAREVKGEALNALEIAAIVENAPTIAIPGELHQKHSETYGGRQHQKIDGLKRPDRDMQDLQRAAKENTDKILESIDKYDPGCKGAYKKAADEITKMTHGEWKKWLKKIMKSVDE
ncbi:hypothetical protein QTI51_23745 [Variovorax sp. J22G73]|uniref:hypothetical protein n=1 Tax=unclassified Variovorax TaxID=663243 RepID=UPI002575520B|nr:MULTISPECIES: hypothetical protein [unclassified Variovorax]MDM0008065.1 hypothetical protein [Variovorax sp. J22R203]MDM0100313.1 hypothetical protein [Variovorax sp. J22G73]